VAPTCRHSTYFLHLSHALLTLDLSLSCFRLLAGGDFCSFELAFEGVIPEVTSSAWSSIRLAGTHAVGLASTEGTVGGLRLFIIGNSRLRMDALEVA
jgi:hypothetical protein